LHVVDSSVVTCQVAVQCDGGLAARRSGLGAAAAHVEIVDSGTTDEAGGGGRRQERGAAACSPMRSPLVGRQERGAGGDRRGGREETGAWLVADALAAGGVRTSRRLRTPGRRSGDRCGGRWQPGSGAGAQHHRGSKGRGVGDRWTGVWRWWRSGPAVRVWGFSLRCGGGYHGWNGRLGVGQLSLG